MSDREVWNAGPPPRPPLSVPGLTVTDPAALAGWLETTDHLHHCTGYSESQPCCLDYLLGYRASEDEDDRPSAD